MQSLPDKTMVSEQSSSNENLHTKQLPRQLPASCRVLDLYNDNSADLSHNWESTTVLILPELICCDMPFALMLPFPFIWFPVVLHVLRTYTHRQLYRQTCTHTCKHARIHAPNTQMHTYVYACAHTCRNTPKHTQTQTLRIPLNCLQSRLIIAVIFIGGWRCVFFLGGGGGLLNLKFILQSSCPGCEWDLRVCPSTEDSAFIRHH